MMPVITCLLYGRFKKVYAVSCYSTVTILVMMRMIFVLRGSMFTFGGVMKLKTTYWFLLQLGDFLKEITMISLSVPYLRMNYPPQFSKILFMTAKQ